MTRQEAQTRFAEKIHDLTREELNPRHAQDRLVYHCIHTVVSHWMIGRADEAWKVLKPLEDALNDEIDASVN